VLPLATRLAFQPFKQPMVLPSPTRARRDFNKLLNQKRAAEVSQKLSLLRTEMRKNSDFLRRAKKQDPAQAPAPAAASPGKSAPSPRSSPKDASDRKVQRQVTVERQLSRDSKGNGSFASGLAKTVSQGQSLVLKEKTTIEHDNVVQCVSFNTVCAQESVKGTLLATGSCSSEVRLYDVLTGEMIRSVRIGNWVTQVTFNAGSRLLAIGGRDNQVSIHDTWTGERIFSLPHGSWVRSVSFSERFHAKPSQHRAGSGVMTLVSADKKGNVRLWPQVGCPIATSSVAFWAQRPSPMTAPRHLPRHILYYVTSPSRRNMLCHAAAADNFSLIDSLLTGGDSSEVLTGCLTRRDIDHRCALDYALFNRNERALRVMLRACVRIPPRAREYAFCYSNERGVPIFLCDLAKHLPHARRQPRRTCRAPRRIAYRVGRAQRSSVRSFTRCAARVLLLRRCYSTF
jgi:hypothetical protein